jgi:DNA-binding PadR family transcriptional regulator
MEVSMSIASDLIRGHTDAIILARLMGGDNYGYEINKAIQQRSGSKYELKEATLYSAFRRLEQAGCIESYWGDETTGARRRYYRITEIGRATYESLKKDWNAAKELIDKLIEWEDQ